MQVYLGVMLGGALGALCRWWMGNLVQGWLPSQSPVFPLGTLLVNVLGCFLLALISTLTLQGWLSPQLRTALGTGFVGAFTTFSTFEWDADTLLRSGRWMWALLYVLGNLLLGFAALQLGRWFGLRLTQ